MSPTGSCLKTDLQLVLQFGEVMELLGQGALLREVPHLGKVLSIFFSPPLWSTFSAFAVVEDALSQLLTQAMVAFPL